MARKKKTDVKRPVESYEHQDKERLNNPPVGLVTPDTDPDAGQKKQIYAYDPHLDPQLKWAGKAEHTSFEVPTVSLHVHERIDPRTIIEAASRSALRASSRSRVAAGCTPTARAVPTTRAAIGCARRARHTPPSASSSRSVPSTPLWNSARWRRPSKQHKPLCPSQS